MVVVRLWSCRLDGCRAMGFRVDGCRAMGFRGQATEGYAV